MASVFPPWSNTAFRVAIVAAGMGGLALLAAPMIYARSPWARGQFFVEDQPLEFDHRHHVRDVGIDCEYCHNTARRAATAGVPSTEKCMGCHDQIWNRSPMLDVVRRSYFSGMPIPWNRVHQLPGFVYFNHAIHVNKGFGCASCHGRVDRMPAVYQVATLTMGFCLDCHRNPERFIRPEDEITNMDWSAGDGQLELGRVLVEERGIRNVTTCTGCHR
jgi:hypothetical protein